ncbi:DUF3037 domain-containing protein [Microbacterium sp. P26]|uniref:DUF3037 domain-containing protein n=1 Tax=Microbacterium TaxID=33882 RepID=UPI0020413790|nr:DUF3037 domain-containing protein [Microbacterium sp. P26]MCM3501095.1 DUF3037 domain-containing protein [Microbacterium sp. P26]
MNEPYHYWLVRYVPDIARGERVNIAVIVGRDSGDWAIRSAPNLKRASRLGGDAQALRPWLESLERSVRDYEHPPLALFAAVNPETVSRAWLSLLSHRFNNILQLSDPVPVDGPSAEEAAEFLYSALVATPDARPRSKTRTRLVQNLNDLYLRTGSLALGESLLRRPRAIVGKQRGRFDFAVVDHRVDQLSHAFAFDVKDTELLEQELQSWNFVMTRLRDDGARLLAGQESHLAQADVPVSVVFQEPPSGADSRARDVFDAALDAWATLGVDAVPGSEMGRIAVEARDLVHN